jgi:hypothetical protein
VEHEKSSSFQIDGIPGPVNNGPSGTYDAPVILFDLRFPRPDFTIEGADALGNIRFDAAPSTTPAGTVLDRYEWEFGDGATAAGSRAEHPYAPGRYRVILRACNGVPLRRSRAKEVTVGCPRGDLAPWTSADVGAVGFAGSARIRADSTTLDVCAGGVGIGFLKDGFLFVYREVEGDFDLAAEVGDLTGARTDAQVGLTAWEGPTEGSAQASILRVKRDPEVVHLFDRKTSGLAAKRQVVPAAGRWLRIARKAGVLAAYHSADGKVWAQPIATSFNPSGKLLVGFAAAGKEDLSAPHFAALQATFREISFTEGPVAPAFLRADTDGSGAVDITDPVVLLGYLFLGGGVPACPKAGDADDSGELDVTDAVYALNYLFLGRKAPAEPFPAPGTDPTPDNLPCGGG